MPQKHEPHRPHYHYHLVLTQATGGNLPRMMDALGTSIAKRFSLSYGHTGHVFESRYRYEQIPTDQYTAEVCRYIHKEGGLRETKGVLQLH